MRNALWILTLSFLATPTLAEWRVETRVDKMTDAKQVFAITASVDGPQSTLTVACMGDKGNDFRLAVLLPFVADYMRAAVGGGVEVVGRWRVDAEKPDTVEFEVDRSKPKVIEFPTIRHGREQWLRKWTGRKRLIIQVPEYGTGLQTIEFDISGFDPAPLAACFKP